MKNLNTKHNFNFQVKPFRLLFLLFVFSCSINVKSQTIPWASQQPKWVFPIYAKDATGARDTVYYGYDPSAGNGIFDDPNFGEVLMPADTINFSMTTYYNSFTDMCLKAHVFNDSTFHLTDLGLNRVVYPLTLYWDYSLTSSDSLPYPDAVYFPKVKFSINYESSGGSSLSVDNNLGDYCAVYGPVIITDTSYDCTCYVRDSLVLSDIFMDTTPKYDSYLLKITPWQNCYINVFENNSNNDFNIYPNPSDNYFIIETKETNSTIFITDVLGKQLKQIFINQNRTEISIGDLPNGIYFVRNGNQTKKLVIQH